MSKLDLIKKIAKAALTINSLNNGSDNFLWDRGVRLANNVSYISQLPDVAGTTAALDSFSLLTAAYFNDAGLAQYLKNKSNNLKPLLSPDKTDHLLELCTEVVRQSLAKEIENQKIDKVICIIIESYSNTTPKIEARILSDARNLDDIGAVAIFNEFRQYFFTGKGIDNALKSWRRKIDYGYWKTRLEKSFQFESVRKIAESRLSSADCFMNQLKLETKAQDIQKFLGKTEQTK